MKSLIVLNGEYYAGENTEDNTLVFLPDRKNAVVVDERRVRFIIQSILRWNMSGEISLRRLEILKAGGVKNV
jgi:hypothetical protein